MIHSAKVKLQAARWDMQFMFLVAHTCTVYEFRMTFREPDQAIFTEEHSQV